MSETPADPAPTYDKYPVVGDASVLRRVFALLIDLICIGLLYMVLAVPIWSLVPERLTFPIGIAETQVLAEESFEEEDETVTVREIQVDYFSLKGQLDSCRFRVTTRETLGEYVTWTRTSREPLAPCTYLDRFDFGTWLLVLLLLFYAPLMEASHMHATVGKLTLALRVHCKDGRELRFPRAFLRNLAEILCIASAGIGYLIALFTTRRQALHDLLTGTVVVER